MSSIVASLSTYDIKQYLASDTGITFEIGPFWVNARTQIPSLGEHLKLLYSDYTLVSEDFADFHVSLKQPKGLRHWFHPQVNFYFDDETPFKPLPFAQTYPFFEWGLNWCIATMAHQYLIIHSAIVAKGKHALVLPGKPGAGKSTLCAALINSGWRLLSDEMTLVDPYSNIATPIPRPVSLKKESINVIKHFASETVFGPIIEDTHKGTVTHIKPPKSSIEKKSEKAVIKWIVFPQYSPNSELEASKLSKARALIQLAGETFNYGTLGLKGFKTLEQIVTNSIIMDFKYSNLDDAISWFNQLSESGQEN